MEDLKSKISIEALARFAAKIATLATEEDRKGNYQEAVLLYEAGILQLRAVKEQAQTERIREITEKKIKMYDDRMKLILHFLAHTGGAGYIPEPNVVEITDKADNEEKKAKSELKHEFINGHVTQEATEKKTTIVINGIHTSNGNAQNSGIVQHVELMSKPQVVHEGQVVKNVNIIFKGDAPGESVLQTAQMIQHANILSSNRNFKTGKLVQSARIVLDNKEVQKVSIVRDFKISPKIKIVRNVKIINEATREKYGDGGQYRINYEEFDDNDDYNKSCMSCFPFFSRKNRLVVGKYVKN